MTKKGYIPSSIRRLLVHRWSDSGHEQEDLHVVRQAHEPPRTVLIGNCAYVNVSHNHTKSEG